jgi:hypothetical protein
MQLTEILKQPDGFTPPDVTVKIEKVWDYKRGTGDKGEWSFQDIRVVGGGHLKLKGLPEFPKDKEGMTVTIKAHSSAQHGLTGLRVAHEEYKGTTYDKLLITKSAKWEFANPQDSQPAPQSNGNGHKELTYDKSPGNAVEPYMAHLFGCASLAGQVAGLMKVKDEQALQACFATICIDTKNRNILLPSPSQESNGNAPESAEGDPTAGAPWDEHDPVDDY